MPSKSVHVLFRKELRKEQIVYFEELLHQSISIYSYKSDFNPEQITILVAGDPTKTEIENLPNLKHLIYTWAGLPSGLEEVMVHFPGITIHNLHHNATPVAENAMALLLAATKRIIPPHNALSHGDWRPRYGENSSILLHGRTALILGYGSIGREIARMLNAFQMKIMATRMSVKKQYTENGVQVFPSSDTMSILRKADILIIALPLTKHTENLIDKNAIEALPHGSIIVNIGRGKVIDQKALYEGLKSGKLGAAAIDVWYNYPDTEESRINTFPADYPLHDFTNIVLSPHRAGGLHAADTERLRMQHLATLLNAAANQEEIPNQVDINRGY